MGFPKGILPFDGGLGVSPNLPPSLPPKTGGQRGLKKLFLEYLDIKNKGELNDEG